MLSHAEGHLSSFDSSGFIQKQKCQIKPFELVSFLWLPAGDLFTAVNHFSQLLCGENERTLTLQTHVWVFCSLMSYTMLIVAVCLNQSRCQLA